MFESGEMKRTILIILVIVLFGPLSSYLEAGGSTEREGRECMDQMLYGEAIRHFKEVLSKNPKKKGIRADLAFSLFRNGEQNKAVQVLEEELVVYPNNIEAYALLGYILFFHNEQGKALKVCQEFDAIYTRMIAREISTKWRSPNGFIDERAIWARRSSKESQSPVEVLILKVYAWKKFYAPNKKEEEEAFKKILRKLCKKHPNIGLPHFIMGLLKKKSGDLGRSEDCFKLALLNGYDRTECYSQLVDVKFVNEDWKGGLQLARKTLEILGPLSKIFFLMGYAYNQFFDGEIAKLYFEEMIKRQPYSVEARKNLAKIYLCESRFEKSTTFLKQVIRLAPLDMEARLLRSRSLEQKPGLTKEGRPVLSKDIVDKVELKYTYVFHSDLENVLNAINQRALSMIRLGHVEHAVTTLRSFLSLHDLNAVLHFNLGLLHLDQNNMKEALKCAWRATKLESDYLYAHDLAGNALFRIGDYERSLLAYQEVARLDPDYVQCYYSIGLVNEAMGKYDRAERYWHTALQKDRKAKKTKLNNGSASDELVHSLTIKTIPVSFLAHKSLGSLYLRLKAKNKALREFEAALEFVPNDSECYFHLGKIYYEMGDMEKAIAHLEKCVYLGTKWETKANDILEKIKKDSEERSFVLKFEDLMREA